MTDRGYDGPNEETVTEFLNVTDRITGEKRSLAYKKILGKRSPGIIFIPGFMGTKYDIKPTALAKFCLQQGFSFVRYDATALGESKGTIELKDARFSHWLQDAEEVLLYLTEGPQLVIGSSMGAWIAACLARKHPKKFGKLLLMAPSINFSNYYLERMRSRAPSVLVEILDKGGHYEYNDPKYGAYPLSFRVFEEMMPYELDLDQEGGYPIKCPVRIIHGTQDTYSPFENSLKLLKGFQSNDIQLLYLKGVDHHLDSPSNLEIVFDTILKMTNDSKL
ncbi:palmitoyl-protein thioesterase ABHD10, mitochondrial-like isoform X1 [Palaemon carinicauda]|uniref:palmitoyl-protein thioesterase ABHD10, mitochondrial-like isoform X1 n=1 Tax=Palaemon carinicauda TaxID=392227 RepID=UPI0035B5AD16